MDMRLTALAAWLVVGATGVPAAAAARVAQVHPDLRLVDARATVLAAEREQVVQRPALNIGADIENALGTGARRGNSSAFESAKA
jgi:cobalt-zinc-cadmium efflux system outer membrane protein